MIYSKYPLKVLEEVEPFPPIQNTGNPYLTEAAMHADQANQLQGYGYLVDGVGAFTYLGTVAGTAADYEGFGTVDTTNLAKLDSGNSFAETNHFNKGLRIAYLDTGGGTNNGGLQIDRNGAVSGGIENPKIYRYIGKNRLSNVWHVYHDFYANAELVMRIAATHGTPYTKWVDILGALNVSGNLAVTGNLSVTGSSTHNVIASNSLSIISGTFESFTVNRTIENADDSVVEFTNKTRQSGAWDSKIIFSLITNIGNKIRGVTIEEKELNQVSNASTEVKMIVNGVLKSKSIDLSDLGSYANDAAANTGGVAIGFAYINSSTGAMHKRLT